MDIEFIPILLKDNENDSLGDISLNCPPPSIKNLGVATYSQRLNNPIEVGYIEYKSHLTKFNQKVHNTSVMIYRTV